MSLIRIAALGSVLYAWPARAHAAVPPGVASLPGSLTSAASEIVLQLGPAGRVEALAFAPDGIRFAVADGTLSLWHTQNGLRERSLEALAVRLESVAWSPDGTLLASGGLAFDTGVWRGAVFLWDARDGHLVRSWKTGVAAIDAVAFSPDGRTLATAGAGDFEQRDERAAARLWDVPGARLRHTLAHYSASSAALAWSPDGGKVALSLSKEHERGGTQVWHKTGGKPLSSRQDRQSGVPAFSGDGRLRDDATLRAVNGKHLLSARYEFKLNTERTHLELRRDARPERVAHLTLDESTRRVALSPDGQWLLTAGSVPDRGKPHPALRVWRLHAAAGTWRLTRHIEPYRDFPVSLAVSSDAAALALGMANDVVGLWDLNNGILRAALSNGRWNRYVALGPDATQLAASFLWRFAPDGMPRRGPQLQGSYPLTFARDGTRLVDAAGLLDTRTNQRIAMVVHSEGGDDDTLSGLTSASFSADGQLLATVDNAQSSHQLHLWDGVTGRFLRRVWLDPGYVAYRAVAFAPQGTLLAVAGREEHWVTRLGSTDAPFLALLDGATGRVVRRFHNDEPYFTETLAFSPDGATLATSGLKPWFGRLAQKAARPGDRPAPTIRLWDVASGKMRGTLPIHAGIPLPFSWVNDDTIAVLAGDLQFWSVAQRKTLAKLTVLRARPEPAGDKTNVAIEWLVTTPDGAFDASSGAGEFMRWRVGGELHRLPPATTRRSPGLLSQVLRRSEARRW